MHQSAIPAMGAIYKDGLDRLLQVAPSRRSTSTTSSLTFSARASSRVRWKIPPRWALRDMQGALGAVGATDAERGAALAFRATPMHCDSTASTLA